jgi:tetratricopeptide (TPR) repeat protein
MENRTEQTEQDDLYRWYLLGATTLEEDERFELQWPGRKVTEQLLIEEELIDDYARGDLAPYECELFEQNFLTTAERLINLQIAQAAVRFAARRIISTPAGQVDSFHEAADDIRPGFLPGISDAIAIGPAISHTDWWRVLFDNPWKIATYAGLVLLLGFGICREWNHESEVTRGLTALKNAFREQRPTEARITDFDYAVSNVTRGGKAHLQAPTTVQRKLDEAGALLLAAVRENENAETLYALGKFYLARREFDKAIEQFEKAIAYNPDDARTHSDFGAALIEKLKSPGGRSRDWTKAFAHINRALELDGDLHEPLFNRALLYHLQNQKAPEEEAWKEYLEKDSSSEWAEEANLHLKDAR